MHPPRTIFKLFSILSYVSLFALSQKSEPQMVTGQGMAGFAQAFGLAERQSVPKYTVSQIGIQAGSWSGVNILWHAENAFCTFNLRAAKGVEIHCAGKLEVIAYQTTVPVGDVWIPAVKSLGSVDETIFRVDTSVGGEQTVRVSPKIPEKFGGYAMIFDLPGYGRVWGGAIARTVSADAGSPQFPTYALDIDGEFEETFRLFQRLGIHGARVEVGYCPTNAPSYPAKMERLRRLMKMAHENHVAIMITAGYGDAVPLPMNHVRPWLTVDSVMKPGKWDGAWLPSSDSDFQEWCHRISSEFGWPKGPLNAMELWNEPWEGISISGWGADIPRFREIYTHMAQGIEQTRRESAVEVLIGGACSSANTRDKLFPDGSDQFLKWLDFVSIHYQPMSVDPALEPKWMHRRSKYGPVRVWDTESWVANSEDRVSAVIASMRAQGQSRTAGIYRGNVYESTVSPGKKSEYRVVQAWAPAAAIAATQKFIGQRDFKKILFKNGLPWVFEFSGLPEVDTSLQNADDGTLVIVGDLGLVYERNRLLFRDVLGQKNRAGVDRLETLIANLSPASPASEKSRLEQALKAATVLKDAHLTFKDEKNEFQEPVGARPDRDPRPARRYRHRSRA